MKHHLSLLLVFCILLINSLAGFDSRFLRVIYQSKTLEASENQTRNPMVNNIKIADQYAYVNNDWNLYIYSIKNIWNPVLETAFSSSFPITDLVTIDYNHFYICSHEPTNEIAEIDSLNMFGRIYFANRLTCNKACSEGPTLYTSHRENGLEIYNVGTGVSPQKISSFSGKWGFINMIARYPYVHAINDFGYVVLDVSDLNQPRVLGTNYEFVDGNVLCINRNIAWVGALSNLIAIDITSPENPVIINRYRFSSDITDVKANNDELYVSLKATGLRILDISNPKLIKEKNSFYLISPINSLAVDGDYIFLGAGTQGWYILEYR